MYLLDTNIFLEFLLGQEKSAACRRVLEGLDEDHIGWITLFSLHAIEAIISRKGDYVLLQGFLGFCRDHLYLSCYHSSLEEEQEIARLAPKLSLDFDDALQYFVARKKKLTLVTLDQDFGEIRDIPVVSPIVLIQGS